MTDLATDLPTCLACGRRAPLSGSWKHSCADELARAALPGGPSRAVVTDGSREFLSVDWTFSDAPWWHIRPGRDPLLRITAGHGGPVVAEGPCPDYRGGLFLRTVTDG